MEDLIDLLQAADGPTTFDLRKAKLKSLLKRCESSDKSLADFRSGTVISLSNPLIECLNETDLLILMRYMFRLITLEDEFVEIQELAIDIIRNMSRFDNNRRTIFRPPRYFDVIHNCIRNGRSPQIKMLALVILNNLALEEVYSLVILRIEGMLNLLVDYAKDAETLGIRKWAIETMRNLAVTDENCIAMCDHALLIPILIDNAENGPNEEIQRSSLWCLSNIACIPRNALVMIDTPRLLNVVLNKMKVWKARDHAFRVLENLASPEPNQFRIAKNDLAIDVISSCISDIRSESFFRDLIKVLKLLCEHRAIQWSLYSDRRIVHALFNFWDRATTSDMPLCKVMFNGFKALGCSSEQVWIYNVIFVLCSVQNVSRVGKSSPFCVINVDLLRMIAHSLIPLN